MTSKKTTAVIGTVPGLGGTPSSDTWMTTYAVPVTPSSLPQASILILQADAAVNAVLAFSDVYGPDKLEEMTRPMRSENRYVMRKTVDVPVLSESQIREAQSAIPNDY